MKAQDFTAQVLAYSLWLMVKAGTHQPAVFEALGEAAAEKAQDFKAEELDNILWAMIRARAVTSSLRARNSSDVCVHPVPNPCHARNSSFLPSSRRHLITSTHTDCVTCCAGRRWSFELDQATVAIFSGASDCIEVLGLSHGSLLQALEFELNQAGVAIALGASDSIKAPGLRHMSLVPTLEVELNQYCVAIFSDAETDRA